MGPDLSRPATSISLSEHPIDDDGIVLHLVLQHGEGREGRQVVTLLGGRAVVASAAPARGER
eukprot:4517468-Lingulodinium_polyedra.AAC.1